MKNSDHPLHSHQESSIQSVLEWLGRNRGHISPEQAEQLFQQIRLVRVAPISTPQRGKLLDLFFSHTKHLIEAELPELHQITLPVSRRLRHRIRVTQDLLETLAQDYLNTLSELFDPHSPLLHKEPEDTLQKVLQCIGWNIQISHLAAAPTPMGLWLELHSTMRTARRLGVDKQNQIEHLYLTPLLAAIAHPASFSSQELDFITGCISTLSHHVALSELPPHDSEGVFWIDPAGDFPAHAIVRRASPSDTPVWFFSCKNIAARIKSILQLLANGHSAETLQLPPLADTASGQRILRRLVTLWGKPGKRRFTRRRQSYRASICLGLAPLWALLHTHEDSKSSSEWIVTNESPDGYAVMHVSGQIGHLMVGDILAIQTHKGSENPHHPWHICLVRWAISENPEHLELGLQLLSSDASPAVIVEPDLSNAGKINGLLIPEAPPLRPFAAVIVESGRLSADSGKLIVLLEKNNIEIREMHTTNLDEQTNRVEVFSVEPDGTM
jgi:cyclic-di-GMP-binding protein